jgi:hypothetical protein
MACLGGPASAAIITIDPATLAPGTDVSTAFPGVTLNLVRNDPAAGNYYSPVRSPVLVTPCAAEACTDWGETLALGSPVINGMVWDECHQAAMGGGSSLSCAETWQVLEVVFDDEVAQVSIESVWTIDPPSMVAVDAAGNQVSSCRSTGPGNPTPTATSPPGCLSWMQLAPFDTFRGTTTLDTGGMGITAIYFASWAGFGSVSSISYSVPEPGALALMGLGLAGVLASRRRRNLAAAI